MALCNRRRKLSENCKTYAGESLADILLSVFREHWIADITEHVNVFSSNLNDQLEVFDAIL